MAPTTPNHNKNAWPSRGEKKTGPARSDLSAADKEARRAQRGIKKTKKKEGEVNLAGVPRALTIAVQEPKKKTRRRKVTRTEKIITVRKKTVKREELYDGEKKSKRDMATQWAAFESGNADWFNLEAGGLYGQEDLGGGADSGVDTEVEEEVEEERTWEESESESESESEEEGEVEDVEMSDGDERGGDEMDEDDEDDEGGAGLVGAVVGVPGASASSYSAIPVR